MYLFYAANGILFGQISSSTACHVVGLDCTKVELSCRGPTKILLSQIHACPSSKLNLCATGAVTCPQKCDSYEAITLQLYRDCSGKTSCEVLVPEKEINGAKLAAVKVNYQCIPGMYNGAVPYGACCETLQGYACLISLLPRIVCGNDVFAFCHTKVGT